MAKKEDTNIYYCVGCGKVHPKGRFYISYNPNHANGMLFYCKNFIKNKVYRSDGSVNLDSFKNILRQLDIPFLKDTYESSLEFKDIVGKYFTMFNSLPQNRGLTWNDSSSENIDSLNRDSLDVDNEIKISLDDFKVTDEMRLYWGDFEKEEYFLLESKFAEYVNTYECDTPAMEELMQQASFESLEIRRKRQKKEDATKNLKNLQDLLGSANIKPNQETGANATEQATFGTLIKRWENENPIPNPLPEWKEKDIFQYVKVWFLGHLSKMLNLNNPYQEEYDKEIEEYKVETPFEEDLESGD